MSKQKILQKDNIQDILALTPIQKGMLFHYQMNADSEVYLEQTTIRITGKLSEREIEQAWSRLEKRYDILRSVFKWEKLKEPVQIIYKKQHNPFQISYGGLDGNDSLEHMMESELKDGVDLSKVPVRIRLYCTTECKYLILTYHHILWDGWSSGILMHAFKQECLNISTGNISEITPKTTPWKEYIKWLKGQKDQKNNQFWNNYLQNMEQVHDLLAWIKETSSSDGDGKYTIVLDHRELSNVQKWCKQHRHTLAGWVHAGWGLLLNRYSMQEHIVFGSTVSGRNAELPGIEQMVGLFINSLPIYVHFEDSLSVSAIVEQIEQGMKERSAYEATPLTDIKEYCGLKGKGELFHSLLVYENYPVQAESVSEIGIEVVSVREETHYDLTLIIMEKDGQLACTFQYKQDQFTIETIEKMANHYKHILLEMVEHYKDSYAEIDCLGYEEKKAVHAWNSTESVYPKDRTMIQLFEEQVEKTPDRAALVEGETIFSYRELNARANQLARMLRESGVKTESIVGLLLDRSIEMVISIFAIHKAGGAYLPLDVNHSSERIAFMLKDSGSEHVLTRKKYLKQLKFDGVVWDIDEKQEVLDSKPAHNLSEVVSPYSLAYIIYTSGSTGKPKGVMIENASLLNTILAMQDHYPLGRNDAFLLKTSHTFDVSVAELFGWFMDGGRLVILQNGAEKDPFQIRLAIKEKGITHINFVPSMLNIFINTLDEECLGDLTTLRYIFAAGEALTSETANKCYGLIQNVSLNNIYGPTEATIYATRYAVEGLQESFNMPIGRPLQNFKAYIMNSHHKLQPVGVPGELCIGGAGLARGYLGQEGLTDEKFISNPFMDGDRMYKTGDLARWLPDGNIQFLSRIDNQVKIRGHRIETREVESRLLEHKFIQEALVMAKGDESFGQYLCAYIVSSNELRVREVRTHLRLTLPEYMIPTYIIPLDSMPLNPNGKVDRKALPQPETHLPVEAEWTAPQNEMEEKLVHIWCDILNIERVGVDHNFFELGGHSLKATILATRIHREWDTVVPLSEIFKFPTIKELATVIYQAQKNHFISIPPLEKRDYYPISSVQKRIYVLNQLDQGTAYNISGVMKLDGVLDIQQLEQAFHQLIRRHEALRTTFHMINGEIYQRIHEHVDFRISVFDGNEDSLAHMLQAFTQPFQLSEGPLLRVGLINLGEASYYLIVDMHHIISDGSSLGILMEEFARYYEGSGNLLSPLRIQYKDFAAWQNEQNQYNEKIKLQETFWLNQFNDEIPILGMPLDYPRPSVQSFEGSRIYFAVDHECNRKLKQFMNETGATLYMVLLAVYNVVLSKYTGQEDIVVGSPVAGRLHEDLHRVIGMFVNTLGMRNKPIGSKTFNMFMDEVKQNALQCFENQDYPFEALVENLDIPRDMSRNPLFDTMFVLQNKSIEICEIEGLKLSPVPFDSGESKFDLTLYAQETDQGISFELEYCTQIFKKETMERMGRHFVRVLSQVISNPDRRLSDVDMLMEDEKQRMQFDYNDTSVSYALDRTVYELFEEQVARTPEDIALVFKGCELTYEALNRKANKIARYLKNKGVGENTLVAIMAERSFEMVIGIMGILKAGAAYVPIDPDYPEERIRYLMDNSNTNILLTQESLMEKLRQEQKEMIAVEEIVRQEGLNEENLQLSYHPKRLMYVLYTSGSTGKPKGVKVRADAFTNLIHWFVSDSNITSKDHTLLIAPISFDLAQKNLYASLVSGGKLCLFTPGIYDYEEMSSTIEKQGITLMNCTPSAFNPLIDVNEDSQFNRLQSLRCIFLGGEPINLSPLKHWAKSTHYHAQIINTYGPTECTDITTSYTIDHAQIDQLTTVPIGKPIHNMKVFILDEFMKMVPTGALGELYIGGIGVADGYFNQPEITAQKFIDIPELCEGKLYRTGDIVKWLPEGTLEFLGRVDHQVKIRGMRVELGEIEARLLKHEDVKEAIVVETGKENHKHLCAYFVAVEEIVLAELKAYMEMELPMHMIPTYFIQLDHIPMTPNGKMDRKSLPAPSASSLVSNIYEAPANDTEMKLAQIWEDVLGIERVGVQDNFFELGGHSLKAVSLVSKMHQALEVDIRVRDIFEGPTIRELGAKVQGGLAKKFTGLVPLQKQDSYPVSSAQKRLYAIQSINPEDTSYNLPMVLTINGNVDQNQVVQALHALVNKHEVLRTSFHMEEEDIVQRVHDAVELEIAYTETSAKEEVDEALGRWIQPFDLSQAPLIRSGIVREGEQLHLLLDMHHIISDGSTMALLAEDFVQAFDGTALEAAAIQYKEYAEWEREQHRRGMWEQQKQYWKQEYAGEIPVLEMPLDGVRGKAGDNEGERIQFEIREETVQALKEASSAVGGTLYMGLMAGFSILLSKYSGQEDLVIGSPIAGRRHAQLEKIAGMFVNTLAIRTQPEGDKKVQDYLREVRDKLLSAYENQEYPYEELVEEVSVTRDMSRNPLFDVMLVLQNTEMKEMERPGVKFMPRGLDSGKAQFDMTISVEEVEGRLACEMEFKKRLYSRVTIERIIKHYIRILELLSPYKDKSIKEIELVGDEERQQLLGFNDTSVTYDRDLTVMDLFEKQVETASHHVAVVYGNHKLSYMALNTQANRLARKLRDRGLGPENIVGLLMERSLEQIVSILAILKAGAAYLPLDIHYPKERLEYMLDDSACSHIISRSAYIDGMDFDGMIWDMDKEEHRITANHELVGNVERVHASHHLAYIIYTSGSTGKPKGVMIEHRSLSNQIIALITDYGYGTMQNHMLYSKTVFDVSVQHVFTALCSGATLHLMLEEHESNYGKLYAYVKKNHIDFMDMVPAQMETMLEHMDTDVQNIRIVLGGEALSSSLYQKLRQWVEADQIYNMYGPTETTINALVYRSGEIDFGRTIPIGKPMRNYRAFILNTYGQLQPIGIPGELCITGEGLARGYQNQPALTTERFVPNPFVPGEIMYRTGDLARWLPDGHIEFIGRMDQQVKIRGYRIELGEIESVFKNQPEVRDTVVLNREDRLGNKYLCAYIVKDGEASMEMIRSGIRKELPDYLVPDVMVEIEKIPLTNNGKIDRVLLLNMDVTHVRGGEYEAPANDTEMKLAQIWEDVLGIERVGVQDNFFELGGHSLKAVSLVSKMHQALEVDIRVRDIFEGPTIRELGAKVQGGLAKKFTGLVPLQKQDSYPVSSAQKRLYAIQSINPEDTSYNLPMVLTINGNVDQNQVVQALHALVNKHEVLRTSFHMEEEDIVQRVHDAVELEIAYTETSAKEEVDEALGRWIQPFDLSQAPLIRSGIVREGEQLHLLLDMHHIISDGSTMALLAEDFVQAFDGTALEAAAIQYKEYAEWEREQHRRGMWEQQKQYWKQEYAGEIPVLEMPLDGVRGKAGDNEGERIQFEIREETVQALKEASSAVGGTLYMGLMAGFSILLSKYSGQEDLVIGSPIAGRRHAQLEKIAGMFVNTLAIRTQPEGDKKVQDYLREVRDKLLSAYENQEYPYEELVEEVSVTRDMSRNPLFDVMLVLQNTEMKEMERPGVKFMPRGLDSGKAQFDMTISVEEVEGRLACVLVYKKSLYAQATIERMIRHYVKTLGLLTQWADKPIKEIELVDDEDRQRLMGFNQTTAPYENQATLVQLFEQQVERTPDAVAVMFREASLTYRELSEKANQFARKLRQHGVCRDQIVGIMMERSLKMIIGIYAVLKAGGAYLPIDPSFPRERVEYMLTDSGTEILLTRGRKDDAIPKRIQQLDLEEELSDDGDKSNLEPINHPTDLAYVIYTSGSTGRPKGAMIEHHSVVNRLNWMQKKYPIGPGDTILQKTTFTFDVSVWELFWWSFQGAAVAMLEPGSEKEPAKIVEAIAAYQITTLHFVPSMLTIFLEQIKSSKESEKLVTLKRVFASGEALLPKQVESFNQLLYRKQGTELINLYGPTEATVDVSFFPCSKEEAIRVVPIGQPIDNTRFYILDKNQKMQPIGVPGELHIAGVGLARGYLNRPELTAEKFVSNPYEQGEKMYRTGDWAKWMPDGNVEYLGRIDHQVKIRGYRIELGEIESVLRKQPGVREAVVLDRQDEFGSKYLCSYIVKETDVSVETIWEGLRLELPDYMIPGVMLEIGYIPVTNNGKMDRKSLLSMDITPVRRNQFEAAANETEAKLTRIWENILGVDAVGVHDNFFELGGHSIKGIKLLASIQQEWHIKLAYRDLYSNPTVRGIASCIISSPAEQDDQIQPIENQDHYETSFAQKRMWLLNQLEPTSTSYNMPGTIPLQGESAEAWIEAAFHALLQRHEGFRTSFIEKQGVIVQRIEAFRPVGLEIENLSELSHIEKRQRLSELKNELYRTIFDLSQAPLYKVKCVKVDKDQYEVIFCIHHSISDGWSMEIIRTEFNALYDALRTGQPIAMKPLEVQYKDFSRWQNQMIAKNMGEALNYWQSKLMKAPEKLMLPVRMNERDESSDGHVSTVLDVNVSRRLNEWAAKSNASLFSVFLSALYVLLNKITGQQDITVGTAVSGREHVESEQMMGCFVNTLLLREWVEKEETYFHFFNKVARHVSEAVTYQSYPLELVLDQIGIPYPEIQVFLNVLNISEQHQVITGYDSDSSDHLKVKFDIVFYVIPSPDEGIRLTCEYRRSKFDDASMEFLFQQYMNLIQEISGDGNQHIADMGRNNRRKIGTK